MTLVSCNPFDTIYNSQRIQAQNGSTSESIDNDQIQIPPEEDLINLSCRVFNEELKHAIQAEVKRLASDCDRAVKVLEQRTRTLEEEHDKLLSVEESSTGRYEKAVREMKFFKQQYLYALNKQKGIDDQPADPIPAATYSLSSHAPSKSKNTARPQPSRSSPAFSLSLSVDESLIDPVPQIDGLIGIPDSPIFRENEQEKLFEFVKNQWDSSNVQLWETQSLSFGGPDELWDTIDKNESTDLELKKMIGDFLRKGESPNTANQSLSRNYKQIKYGFGLLHAITVIKSLSCMDLLLQHRANPNATTLDKDSFTAAYLAASTGWLTGLKRLVAAGAVLDGKESKDQTALQVAAKYGHFETVKFIVSVTTPSYHEQADSIGADALHYAAVSGHAGLAVYLLQTCHLSIEK
ncbi:hypothetical protein G6F66_004985 [Rhizopus arrhizus]|nr:hypothetical protein G6F66_004985 [Rhizopus arrhizus]